MGDLVRFAVDEFGPDRAMFESNFPMDRPALSYVTLRNAYKKISAGYSASERQRLFLGTARQTYRI